MARINPASMQKRENTTTSERTARAGANLKLAERPIVRHQKGVFRYREMIAPDLRAKISRCAFGQGKWPLLITGQAGVGKTCAALCLLDIAASMTQYFTVAGLCDTLIRAMKGELDTPVRNCNPQTFWNWWARSSLCVVDEIGSRGIVSDHHYETLKAAIDSREGKPLVLISNLSLSSIGDTYDDRIASRIGAGTIISVGGPDRRMEGGR